MCCGCGSELTVAFWPDLLIQVTLVPFLIVTDTGVNPFSLRVIVTSSFFMLFKGDAEGMLGDGLDVDGAAVGEGDGEGVGVSLGVTVVD